MRQKEGARIYFVINHQSSPVRLHFYKPVHDYLTGAVYTGNYDLAPPGVLVIDEKVPAGEEGGEPAVSAPEEVV